MLWAPDGEGMVEAIVAGDIPWQTLSWEIEQTKNILDIKTSRRCQSSRLKNALVPLSSSGSIKSWRRQGGGGLEAVTASINTNSKICSKKNIAVTTVLRNQLV